jgi:hypothetical protein
MTTGKPAGGVRAVTLTVRFLVELGLLAALAYWGFVVGDAAAAFVLGIGAPLLAAVVWGMFVAPKARRPVSVPVRLAIEVVLFGAGAAAGRTVLGIAFGAVSLATSAVNAAREGERDPSGA